MNNKSKLFRIFTITAIIGLLTLYLTGCGNNETSKTPLDDGGEKEGESSSTGFTSMTAFGEWLEKQPANTPDNPYRVKLNIRAGQPLNGYGNLRYHVNWSKYVYLDCSGSTVTGIEEDAFKSCTSLIGITMPNSVTSIGASAFYETGLINVIIPDNVTDIGEEAFSCCGNLTSITIPNSVSSIGKKAFSESGLTSIKITDSVTDIADSLCWNCTSLANITIPDGVNSIGRNAFQNTIITGITIPGSVTDIGRDAFSGCTSLTSVTFQGTIVKENFGDSDSALWISPFDGDLRDTFYVTDSTNGTPGTYTRSSGSNTWSKL